MRPIIMLKPNDYLVKETSENQRKTSSMDCVGCILDCKYWNMVMGCSESTWDYYEQKYRPLYKQLMHIVRANDTTKVKESLDITKDLVVDYIKSNGVVQLGFDFSLILYIHPKHKNIVHIRRDPKSSPLDEPIVKQCNGLVIDIENYKILSRPYFQFLDYEPENVPNKIKTDGTEIIYEKLDGKLITVYYYDGVWNISTSLTADGSEYKEVDDKESEQSITGINDEEEGWKKNLKGVSRVDPRNVWKVDDKEDDKWDKSTAGLVNGKPRERVILYDLFWNVWKERCYRIPDNESDKNICFFFNLVHPHSTKVKTTSDEVVPDIIFHGCRDMNSMEELNPNAYSDKYHWKLVKSFEFSELLKVSGVDPQEMDSSKKTYFWEVIHIATHRLNPLTHPGFVVKIRDCRRINMLSPQYIALCNLHELNDRNTNWRLMLDMVRCADDFGFMSRYKPWMELFRDVKREYDSFLSELSEIYNAIRNTSPSEFARVSSNSKFSGILFQMKKEKIIDVKKYISRLRLKMLMSYLKK
eukprot:TRINITY_DN546_c0_g1_i3.p1 TRINITY_DN546_c0_g1~~TRINITY_DN546_c0_g1_i3.p1  ORF type:complete len:527 (-),score=43.89 TRINITY_DN546_c0_g1_i3:24-1604(-)